MNLPIEYELEADGRWIAEVPSLPGVLVYGVSRDEARRKVQALALSVLAGLLEQGELPEIDGELYFSEKRSA